MASFKLSAGAKTGRTYRVGSIEIPPKSLVDRFGSPEPGDGYKTSGCYAFESDLGNVFTVYDYKSTSLFDDGVEKDEESFLPTPDDYWGNWNPERLEIGGHGETELEEFKNWLSSAT